MKLIKKLLAGVFLVTAATAVQAQTTIVITGSSAYRSSVNNAILNVSGGTAAGLTYAFFNTATTGLNSANAAIFKGTIAGNSVIIKTSWSGSAAGIQTVAQTSGGGAVVGVFEDDNFGAANNLTTTSAGQQVVDGGDPRTIASQNSVPGGVRPDIAFADNTQSSTPFNGTYLTRTYAVLTTNTQNQIGIVPFQWVASTDSTPYGTLNITPQFARSLYTSLGAAPLALLTGNPAHESVVVVGTGRDIDSGTRIVTFAETGLGINTAVQQYRPTVTSGAVTALALYPATTVNGVPSALGNGGETSGGTVATNLGATGPSNATVDAIFGTASTDAFLLSYVGTSDATTAINAGAKACNYNGVGYSVANVQNGSYTFWGYEYAYTRPSPPAIVLSTFNSIVGNVKSTTATITTTSMRVQRSIDGGTVAATYF